MREQPVSPFRGKKESMAEVRHTKLYDTLMTDLGVLNGTRRNFLSLLSCFFGRAGFQAVVLYRFAAACHGRGPLGRLGARFFARLNVWFNACDIDTGSLIGAGLKIPHPCGIVIGLCSIGSHVMILQNVTIGLRRFTDDEMSPGNYPVIGSHVIISSGAAILGGVRIGDHVAVGANAVVLDDIPSYCTAVGIPARITASKGKDA